MRLILIGDSTFGTTATRRILSAHNRVWITNGLNIYCDSFNSFSRPEDYFNFLSEKMTTDKSKINHSLPPWVDYNKFVESCMSELEEDSVLGMIKAVEAVLFENKFKYFGDTSNNIEIISRLKDTKVIFIYRDGRDVAIFNSKKHKLSTIKDLAHKWACDMESITKNIHNFDECITLRFEDFVEYPEISFDKMSSFLDLNLNRYKKLINVRENHIGYYEKNWINWRKEATDKTKKMLSLLGYI